VKLLLDTCVPSGVRDALLDASHDVEWCGEWPSDPGDEEILARARQDQRVVVTLDKDFGELAVVRGADAGRSGDGVELGDRGGECAAIEASANPRTDGASVEAQPLRRGLTRTRPRSTVTIAPSMS
jgi:hypothetical protein